MSSHDENRIKVCVICWRKGSCRISRHQEGLIRRFVLENFDPLLTFFPNGICTTCKTVLLAFGRGDFRRTLPITDSFDANLPYGFRSMKNCCCRICMIARNLRTSRNRALAGRSSHRNRSKVCPRCLSSIYRGCRHSLTKCQGRKTLVHNIVSVSCDRRN